MSVSVVICAYTERRWDDLVAAVESARAQSATGQVVLVIDHNAALLQRAESRWPDLEILPNAGVQGLSGARNTGTAAATCDLVAYLDDDARADEHWLEPMVDALTAPDVLGVGGRADPVWPRQQPWFLPRELYWVVGCTYTGQPETLAEVRNVMGCSMLFRRDQVLTVGGFSSDTGRVGSIPLGGEETDLCIRLRRSHPGSRILFEPRSVVHHRVSADRASWRYLLRRGFYEGVSKAVLSGRLGADDALESERAYSTVVLPRAVARSVLTGRPLAAAGIIVTFTVTVAGYLYGRTARRHVVPAHGGPAEPAVTGATDTVDRPPQVAEGEISCRSLDAREREQ
jgi:GT2 family glycosyltransferase